MKATHLKSNRVTFQPTHPNYPSNVTYDSWTTLCEHTLELAIAQIECQFPDLVDALAQEMMATAEEVPCP